MSTPQLRNTSGTSISQRFGYYFIGIAIGLVLLGFFMSSRQRAVRAQEAEAQAAERSGSAESAGSVEQGGATPDPDGP